MDWLRRNWPDLAIGIALVAVIAGIIATLLTGGSFFPLTPTQPAVAPMPPAVTEPAPPVAPETPETTPETTPEAAPEVPREPEAAPDVPSPEALQPGVAVLAPDGSPADEPAPTEEAVTEPPPSAPSDEVAEAPPETATPTPSEPAAPTAPPSDPAPAAAPAPTAPTAPLPSAAADPEAPFRVSVGAFGNPENAARQADTFRSAGYPVFTGVQGELTLVLVGPYQVEADAAAVAARIRAGGFGIEPVVYRFQSDASSAASSAPGPSAPAEPPPSEPTPTPAATPSEPRPTPAATPTAAPSATAGRYLQVGAFASAQSAQPLREQLEGLGFAASEVVEDGMVKLLVGPFDEASVSAARQRLQAQGIPNFPR